MRVFLVMMTAVFMVACVTMQNPLDGIDLPEPEEPHLFHTFIKGAGYVKHAQTEKLTEARAKLETVIAEDNTIMYPEAYPYLVDCYRQLGIIDSAEWIYAKAQEKLAALPKADAELVTNINGWAEFYPELPDSFKVRGFMIMEKGPEPMGGMRALYSRLEYPEMAKNMNRTGVTYLSLVVKANGSIQGLQVLKSSYPDLDAAAIAAVEASSWVPAKYRGRPVPFQMVLPIYFGI